MKDFEIPKELLDLVHNIAKEAYEEGYKDGQLDVVTKLGSVQG